MDIAYVFAKYIINLQNCCVSWWCKVSSVHWLLIQKSLFLCIQYVHIFIDALNGKTHHRNRTVVWINHLHTKRTFMMTSSNGNIFRVTGLFVREFTGHRWIPHTKARDKELDIFFDLRLSKRLNKNSRNAGDLRRHCGHYDVTVLFGLTHKWSLRLQVVLYHHQYS